MNACCVKLEVNLAHPNISLSWKSKKTEHSIIQHKLHVYTFMGTSLFGKV